MGVVDTILAGLQTEITETDAIIIELESMVTASEMNIDDVLKEIEKAEEMQEINMSTTITADEKEGLEEDKNNRDKKHLDFCKTKLAAIDLLINFRKLRVDQVAMWHLWNRSRMAETNGELTMSFWPLPVDLATGRPNIH
jgi:uncharacterized protein YqgV (UPF0045/DUF77 family)